MMQNTLSMFNKDRAGLTDQRHGRVINLNACIFYCDLGSQNMRSDAEYVTCMWVMYGGLEYVLGAVNDLLLRLHKMACHLLHTKPALTDEAHTLPDIVTDTIKSSKNKFREGPDLVPIMARSLPNIPNHVQQSHLGIAAHSSHDRLKYDSCVCRDFDATNQFNSLCHNHGVGNTFGQGAHKETRPIVNNNDNSTATIDGVQLQNSQIPSKTIIKPCFNYHKSDRPRHRKFHISNINTSGHGNNNGNELDKTCVVVSEMPNQILPSPRPHSYNVTKPQEIVSDLQTRTHEHAVHHADSDFTRDIVLALRTVGDNLDARMRFPSEMSAQAVFGPTKIRGRWLVLTALRKYYTPGVIVSVSLELLQQFNRL